jgi:hypothetical protein
MSDAAGAVDLVTLQTTNGGVTWYQTVTAAGAGFAMVIAPSPATGTVEYSGADVAPSVTVTATAANETGTVTYSWLRDDTGGTDFLINSSTAANPTFSIAAGPTAFNATQRWRCTATDSAGPVTQAIVNVTLARTVAGGLSVSLTLDDTDAYVIYPATPSAQVTQAISGGTAPYSASWSRIDANGGANFAVTFVSAGIEAFTSAGVYYSRQQTWRCTVTDSLGAVAFDDVTVNLERSA